MVLYPVPSCNSPTPDHYRHTVDKMLIAYLHSTPPLFSGVRLALTEEYIVPSFLTGRAARCLRSGDIALCAVASPLFVLQ